MRLRFAAIAILVLVGLPLAASAHGGGLDALGCHHNRKQGGYHCHRGPLAGQYFGSKAEAQKALAALEAKKSKAAASEPAGAVEEKPKTLSPAEAKERIGELATVCGLVASTRYEETSRGRPTFLDLGEPYPNHEFTIVIAGENRAEFGKPETGFKDKQVCTTGRIESYLGVPQIEAKKSGDIVLKGSKISEN